MLKSNDHKLKNKPTPPDEDSSVDKMSILRRRNWWVAAAAVLFVGICLAIFFLIPKPLTSTKAANIPKKTTHLSVAHPAGGFQAFEKYLKDSLQYPPVALRQGVEGVVILSFIVTKDSTLKKIKIKQSLGYGCDEEAIRLLKQGPKWIPAANSNDSPSRQKVNVSFHP